MNIKNIIASRESIQALLILSVIAIVLFTIPGTAMAQALPWETGTCKMAKAFTGPWLGWVAVIAIVVAAISFAVGELNGPMKNAMTIVGGVSIATAAATVVGWFWPGLISAAAC